MKAPAPRLSALSLLLLITSSASALETGELVLADDFSGDTLAKGWAAQYGEWKPVDGVLAARQIPADNHAAAARRALPMGDGAYEMRFRLTGKGQAFHFGFDPAPGQLKKRGHLFSLIVTPAGAKLMKHVDKDQPQDDPNEDLAIADAAFRIGVWHTLRLEKRGNDVTASLRSETGDVSVSLTASHPTFHVKTPTLVFRCVGDGVEIDDLKVWKPKN